MNVIVLSSYPRSYIIIFVMTTVVVIIGQFVVVPFSTALSTFVVDAGAIILTVAFNVLPPPSPSIRVRCRVRYSCCSDDHYCYYPSSWASSHHWIQYFMGRNAKNPYLGVRTFKMPHCSKHHPKSHTIMNTIFHWCFRSKHIWCLEMLEYSIRPSGY